MQRHIVIGDIHGCFAELEALLAAVAATPDDVIVSVGDLVDRGPEPAEVVRFFRARPGAVVLAGNHERKHVRGVRSYAQEITRLQLGDEYDEIVRWMGALPYYLELPDAIVVHAALAPGVPLAAQKPEVLCGSTAGEHELERQLGDRRWHELWDGDKPVIFGHHVVEEPLIRPGKIYGIDTGACHGGRLTAVILPGLHVHSVPARADHWALAKRRWQADVLAAKPWRELPWADLDEQLARAGTHDEPRAQAYAEALRRWRDALDGRMTEVLAAIAREAQAITASGRDPAEAARAHPLSKLVFQQLGGRLDLRTLRRQCQTPRRLAELSAALGLPPLEPPPLEPPGDTAGGSGGSGGSGSGSSGTPGPGTA